jgi:hypothetical protein
MSARLRVTIGFEAEHIDYPAKHERIKAQTPLWALLSVGVSAEITGGLMALRAIAFHESISVNALERLFKSEWHQLFAATTFAHCKKCGALFAVFLPKSDDPENGPYVAELEKRITEDCKAGKHSLVEIRLDMNP